MKAGATMICHIEHRIDEQQLITLHLSGEMRAARMNMLRNMIDHKLRVVPLDLTGVEVVKHRGVEVLARCQLAVTELKNCPSYVREWITRERDGKASQYPVLSLCSDTVEDRRDER